MTSTGDPAPRRAGQTFVGRDREVAELVAGLEDAGEGRGRLFLIAGEPGIGKTWLAERVAGHAAARGMTAYWGRCWEAGGAPPFWPWTQLLDALAESLDDQFVAVGLGPGVADVARMVPALAKHLGPTALPAAASRGSDVARFYLFEAITGLLKKASAERPLLLVLEDLHAADDSSLLLLEFLARQMRDAPLLVLATYRDAETDRQSAIDDALGELVRDGQLINLQGLDRGAVKALIEALCGVEASEEQVAAVHERTEGNPLFIREVVRLLGTGTSAIRTVPGGVPIPDSVRAVIWRRLAPLSAEAVRVLSVAAVVGREFNLAVIGPACRALPEHVVDALSEAIALGVAAPVDGAVGGYRFSHGLMREVLYERLPTQVRMQLHRRVGEAIEDVYGAGSDAHLAELARHFAEVAAAGQAAKALAYARQAGERAMGVQAYEEAANQFQRALEAQRFVGSDEHVRCELLLRLGAAQISAGDYQHAKESCLQAAEISRRLGAPEQLARAALGFGEPQVEGGLVNRQLVGLLQEALDALDPQDSPLRAQLLARMSLEFIFSDEVDRTQSLSLEAVAMARRLADRAALRAALETRWMAMWGPDGLEERIALAEETLHTARETGDREMELTGHAQRAATLLESGDAQAVQADIAAHARLVDELPVAIHRWAATTMRVLQAVLSGSFEEGERLANEALSLQPRRPNVVFTHLVEMAVLRWDQGRLGELRDELQHIVDQFPRAAFAQAWLALADAELGDQDGARRGLSSLTEVIPQLPRNGIWLPAVAVASVLSARLDEPEAASSLHGVLSPYADHIIAFTAPQPLVCLGSASFYLALLATATSRWVEATDHFEAAVAAHEKLRAMPWLARTRYEYARMLLARGRPVDKSRALGLLDLAGTSAEALGMVAVVAAIHALQAPSAAPSYARSAAATETVAPGAQRFMFRREGEYWTIAYEGAVARLKDAKGMRHLARLLAHPGREFLATYLEAADSRSVQATLPGFRFGDADRELEVRPDFGDAGALLDATAKAAYRARLEELETELEEAESFNDTVRATNARHEREFLVGELARAVGLGGRDRKAASHSERARLNVTRAIRAAMARLTSANPALGRHLAATIHTGRYCSYAPDPRVPIDWVL